MGFEQAAYFLASTVNGLDQTSPQTLQQESLYVTNTIKSDKHFKRVYRSGDYLNLNILGSASVGNPYFLKDLYVFSEYIDYGIKLQYFDIHNTAIVSSSGDWPELLFALSFQSFSYGGGSYSVKAISYNNVAVTSTTVTYTLVPISANSVSLFPPANFKRLDLITTKNLYYSTYDLVTTASLTCTSGNNQLICFDNNKAMTCEPSYWLDLTSTPYSCNSNCPSTYTSYAGVSTTKGMCNYACTGGTCPNSQSQLESMSPTTFTCASSSYTNVYYNCVNTSITDTYSLYYNSYFSPANIYLQNPPLPSLYSYIIEIWYFPDNTMPKAQYLFGNTANKYYVFYSNTVRIYRNSSGNYFFETSFNVSGALQIDTNANWSNYEWTRFIFNVQYTGSSYSVQLFINGIITTPVSPVYTDTNNQSLSYILFCNVDPSSCNGQTIYWGSGWYKNLRVWNGDLAQPFVLSQYDTYYPSLTVRSSSIGLFYPFTIKYIANNYLQDPYTTSNNFYVTSTNNAFELQDYNFNYKFDYIAQTATGKYATSIVDTSQVVTTASCDVSCARCFGTANTSCYACNTGYFLTESTCNQNSNGSYIFVSPSTQANDLKFTSFTGMTPAGTVSFWIKIFGFSSATADVIKFGSNLKLYYNSNYYASAGVVNTNYGLSLVGYSGSTIGNYYATYANMRNYFGQWTFISLAYYYSSSYSTFFPPMMSFAINQTNLNILCATSTCLSSLDIANFVVSGSMYGMIHSIKAYTTYIVGVYGFELNKYITNAFRKYYLPSSIKFPNLSVYCKPSSKLFRYFCLSI